MQYSSTRLHRNHYQKKYITHDLGEYAALTINGILEDEAWNLVEWGGNYIEWQPDENTPPTHQTKFKILYDSKNLYIGVRCYDSEPDEIVKRLFRRDGFGVRFKCDAEINSV